MRRSMLVLLCAVAASSAFAKSLHWSSFDVAARLDADGRLHVREQQAIVFDGDWNGGERRFNIRPGQSLTLERIARVENGQDIPLTQGDLSQVDHWDFYGNNVVRWRSRLASDPPFLNREITYAIDYILSGVLQRSDRGARLNHDFAFPDRDGTIENFSLRLDIDPVWRGLPSPFTITRQNIPPGQGVVVNSVLTYTGTGKPLGVQQTVTESHAWIIILLLLAAGLAITVKFYIDEKHRGRFAPLFPGTAINETWLDRYVFSMPPEVVGYAWDETTGAPEVGAVIARMQQEKKLTATTTQKPELIGSRPVLHLKLNVDGNTLPAGEKELVFALFQGSTETDTDQIHAAYRDTGFKPQEIIKPAIDAALKNVPEWNQPASPVRPLEIITFVVMLISGWYAFHSAGVLGVLLFGGAAVAFFGLGVAISARRRVDVAPWAPLVFAWAVIAIGGAAVFKAAAFALTDFAAANVAIAAALAATCLLLVGRSREAIAKMEFRRRLAAARKYFETQLHAQNPKLHDAWYPYLVALGLGPNVDRWFKNFASAAGGIGSSLGSSSHSSFGSSSGSSWTGGGGAFGGAGASGSWAAMSAIAGGVATPGSSGGGGGGGGGGSGGGGGGGW